MNALLRNILIVVHLLLMFCLTSVNSFFLHSHTLADGTTIVHAHPYNKSKDKNPNNNHQHRPVEYLTLSNSMFYTIPIFGFELTTFENVNTKVEVLRKKILSSNKISYDINNKAPPVLLS